MTDFGIKELYFATLSPTLDMKINGVEYKENEPIITFDKIQINTINEHKRRVAAQGGYGNPVLVAWDETREVSFQLSEGVISKEGLSILSNSRILSQNSHDFFIPYGEISKLEIENNTQYLPLKHQPVKNIFIKLNGEKITNYTVDISSNPKIKINSPSDLEEGTEIAVYYDYIYTGGQQIFSVGTRAITGFLKLTARARLKDDQTGKEQTVLITIPKVRLASDLTMRLGSNVLPEVYNFQMVGYPVGNRSAQYVCEMVFLDKDIDADF